MRSFQLNVPILLAAAQTQSAFELPHSGGVFMLLNPAFLFFFFTLNKSQSGYWCQFYFNNISSDLQIVSGLLRCYFANLQRCCCTVRRCTTTLETVKMFPVFCRSSVAIRHAVLLHLLFQTCPAAFVWTPYLHYKFEETVTFAYPVIAFSSVGCHLFIFTVPVCVCATLRFLLEMKW